MENLDAFLEWQLIERGEEEVPDEDELPQQDELNNLD